MSESSVQREIRKRLGELGVPAFRNNVGVGWAGSKVIHHGDGSVTILNARPLHAGLCEGSSDLIGIVPHTIRPEDVGRTLGVILAAEVKKPKGRTAKSRQATQGAFLRMINRLGGLGAIVRSAEDAESVVRDKWNSKLVIDYTGDAD